MHSFLKQQRIARQAAAVFFCLVLGVVAAFLIGMMPANGSVSQAYADEAHALLYEDGTLVFQNSAADEADEGVVQDIPFDTIDVYTAESLPPWNEFSDSVTEIVVEDSIQPSSSCSFYFYGMSACKSMNIAKLDCSKCKDDAEFANDGNSMFEGCSSLVSLVLPTSLAPWDNTNMFNGCSTLVSVNLNQLILDSCTVDTYGTEGDIGNNVFGSCANLRYISYPKGASSWSGVDGATASKFYPISIPDITQKTWYLVNNIGSTTTVYEPNQEPASCFGSGNRFTCLDPLPLSECDLEVVWEDGSPDYYVATGEGLNTEEYDNLPVGAKLNESLDYTLGAYFDADCTVSAENYDENAVYYFKANQVADYVAFEGSTDVVASMKEGTAEDFLGSNELAKGSTYSFDYYFGDIPSDSISVSSSDYDAVAVSVTESDEGGGWYTITLSPEIISADETDTTTITLGCTAAAGDKAFDLSISFDVTVGGEAADINQCEVSVEELTYNTGVLNPAVTLTDNDEVVNPTLYTYSFYSDSDCTISATLRNAGTYWVKVEGTNTNYYGEKVVSFEVAKADPTLDIYDPNNWFGYFTDPSTPLELSYGQTWQTDQGGYNVFYIRYALIGNDDFNTDYEITLTATQDGVVLSDDEVVTYYEKPTGVIIDERGNFSVTPYVFGDFTIDFSIQVEGGNYNDVTTPLYFTVSAASLTSADITATLNDPVYNGASHIPNVTVTLGDSVLDAGSDYELIYYSDEACQNVVSADDLVDAGTYYVKASGVGNYSGMTSAASFSIEKAAGSLSVDPTTLDLDTEGGVGEVSVVYIGDGDIVVTSSDESIATATYTDGVVTVTPVAAGTASINISAGEGTNYNAVSAVVVEVTVSGTSPEPQPTPEPGPGPAEPKDMTVYAGADRWQTANLIAAEVAEYGSYSGVIVCSGVNGKYADALSASGLSGVLDYPVVLTDGSLDGLDADTASAVSALLGNSKGDILILGGENTVSAGIESGLSAYGSVERVAGDDRYATSQAVYAYGSANGTWSGDYAVVAIGNNFPDALGAASFCTSQGVPMLLTNRDSATLESYVQSAVSGVGEIVIAGGTTSIPDNKISNLKNTVRLAGDDRYATNLKFADWALENGMVLDGAGVATGTSFPDSLGSSYLLSITDSVLLLSSPTDNSALYDLLSQNADDINAVSVFGGENSVSTEVREAIQTAIGGEWQVTTK